MSNTKLPRTLRPVPAATMLVGLTTGLCTPSFAAGPTPAPSDEILVEGKRVSTNPYADEAAPYKIDRSANKKLVGDLLDVSKSVQVIPKELIEDAGTNTFRDVMRIQPGVTIGTGEGGNAFGDRVFIRGFDARNDVYIDGLRDPGVTSRETFAVEQIEVLKGPSGAFAGRGTTGGAVSLISKVPFTDANFSDVEVSVGTQDTLRLTADINQVMTDKVGVRLNALYQEGGIAGRDEVFSDRWGVAGAISFTPTDQLSILLDYYHLTTDEMPDYGHPYDIANNRPFDVDRDNFYGLVNRDFRETDADIYTARADWDISEAISFSSILRMGETSNAYVVTAPERPDTSDPDPANWTLSANPKNRNSVNEYIANQTDLTFRFGTDHIQHTLIAGIELSNEEITNRPYAFLDSEDDSTGEIISVYSATQSIYAPDPFQDWPFPLTESGSVSTAEVDSKAFYLIDTVNWGEKWIFTGGLRFDNYDVSRIAVGGRGEGEFANESDLFNWHLGATYKPQPNGSFYVAYGSSSNPSGEQLDGNGAAYGGLSSSDENLDPEKNVSFEIGTKWAVLDEHLLVTAALFQIDKTDARVQDADRIVTLDGEQRVRGFEIGAAGNLTEKLSVYTGYTYLDTEITESVNTDEIGAKFPNVAENSFNALIKYEPTENVGFGTQFTYEGERYGGTSTALDTFIPDYWRMDAFANWELNSHVEISVNVQNITDEVYYDAIYRSGTPFVYIAPGRAALLTLDFDF